jgi:hypothetical protein
MRTATFTFLFILLSSTLGLSQQTVADRPSTFRITSPASAAEPGGLPTGSVGGRVLTDGATEAAQGVAGVRVLVRSADSRYSQIIANQISDVAGTYNFSDLPPGKYSIEIDPLSVPSRFRPQTPVSSFEVHASARSTFDIPLSPQRIISGLVFIDKNGDGQYQPGKDELVAGAFVEAGGQFAISNQHGRYVLRDLPAGRLGLLVAWPNRAENSHVILDLGPGPVTNRTVNICRSH